MTQAAFVQQNLLEAQPAPRSEVGILATLRKNLFSTPISAVLTLLGAALVVYIVPGLVRFLFTDAVWSAPDGAKCRVEGAGACWAFIERKMPYLTYGSYPVSQRWRVDVAIVIGAILILWLLRTTAPRRNLAAGLFFLVYPILGFFLLHGFASIGLPVVDTTRWGGIFVTLLMALVGIVFSLPLGIILALGRRSKLPVIRFVCTIFIEFARGVPFITVLFMANTMLPLFVPDAYAPDRLLRPMIGTALFGAAYMAEVVRGGLQAMPRGQFEGAMAMGLNYAQMMRLVVLPQALVLVIPAIVNSFISQFKDTTLVSIVGIFDFLNTIDAARIDPVWDGPYISTTAYTFAALFYFSFCFSMSRYSQWMERKLATGRNR